MQQSTFPSEGILVTSMVRLADLNSSRLHELFQLFNEYKADSADFLELCVSRNIHVECALAVNLKQRVVGAVLLVPRYTDNTYIACAYLHSVAVDPDVRGEGVAKRLVKLCMSTYPIYTHVGVGNAPAIKLMTNAGLLRGDIIPSDVGRRDTPSLAAVSGLWDDYILFVSDCMLPSYGQTRNDTIQVVKVPALLPTLPNLEFSSEFLAVFADLQKQYNIEHQWCNQATVTVVSAFGHEVYLQPDLFDSRKLTLMLDNVACTIHTPFTKQQWVAITEALQPQLAELNVRMFAPRPFDVVPCRGDEKFDQYFTWVDNEYVHMAADWPTYLDSLNAKRRYKVNAALKECAANNWHFEPCELSEALLDEMAEANMFDHPNGEEDSNHLLRFHLYAFAGQQFDTLGAVRTFCLRGDDNRLIACGSIIHRYGYATSPMYYFHSLSCLKDCNAATIWLVNLVKYCIESMDIGTLDLTTGSDFEPHSYDTYKRVVSNFTRKLGAPHCAVDRAHAYGPPVVTDKGWVLNTGD